MKDGNQEGSKEVPRSLPLLWFQETASTNGRELNSTLVHVSQSLVKRGSSSGGPGEGVSGGGGTQGCKKNRRRPSLEKQQHGSYHQGLAKDQENISVLSSSLRS